MDKALPGQRMAVGPLCVGRTLRCRPLLDPDHTRSSHYVHQGINPPYNQPNLTHTCIASSQLPVPCARWKHMCCLGRVQRCKRGTRSLRQTCVASGLAAGDDPKSICDAMLSSGCTCTLSVKQCITALRRLHSTV